MTKIEALLTIDDIMQLVPGLSKRSLKSDLRSSKHAYEIHGKLYLSTKQFKQWIESKKLCQETSVKEVNSGTLIAQSPDLAYDEALKLATKRSQNIWQQKSKRERNVKRSLGQNMNIRSPKPALAILKTVERKDS